MGSRSKNRKIQESFEAEWRTRTPTEIARLPKKEPKIVKKRFLKDDQDQRPFGPWDGGYDKVGYEVLLDKDEIVVCWPNAGWMNALDGTGRKFGQKHVRGIRLAPERW